MQAVLEDLDNGIADHLADSSAAHAASAISVNSATLVGTGTDVQAVFEEVDNAIVAAEGTVTAHLADSSAAHAASAISVSSTTLAGTGTDAQAVFEELDNAIAATDASVTSLPSFVTGAAPNDQVVVTLDGDEVYGKLAGSERLLAWTAGTNTSVTSTSSETTLGALTPVANILAAQDHLIYEARGTILQTSGSDQTFRLRLDVGGTDVLDTTATTVPSNAAVRLWSFQAWCRATSTSGGTFTFWHGRFTLSGAIAATFGAISTDIILLGNALTTSFSSPSAWDLTITHGSSASTSTTACNFARLYRVRLGS